MEQERRRRGLDQKLNNRIPQFKFRGAALELQTLPTLAQNARPRELVISGPSETGKTVGALKLVDTLCRQYPKATGVIVRKVHRDMAATVLKLYQDIFVAPVGDIRIFGGEHPEFYEYPNGTRLYVSGLDRPGKVLSGALDLVYGNQVEELTLEDWEYLTTRTTGRAGVIMPGYLIGDANPGPPTHWILSREREGKLVKLESHHEDNPRLFNDDGSITPQGIETLKTLDNLTGVRRDRLRFGRWVSAEGVVYEEFDPALHLLEQMPAGWETWRKICSVDFGFTNPFSYSWWAVDPDGRMYLYRQIYMTQRTVKQHAAQINKLDSGERIERRVADHDAEDRATLAENGISTIAAKKEISVGIEKVKERLKKAGDGKPRIFFMRGALVERDESLAAKHKPLCTADELLVYSYPKAADGKPIKEVPLDMDNHGCDDMRYAVMSEDKRLEGKLMA